MSEQVWKVLKWVGVTCFIFSTVILLNPIVASKSITPWVAFVFGNMIWIPWAIKEKDWPLFGLCFFYFSWDTMIAISRFVPSLFDHVQPIIKMMEIFK